MRRSGDSETTLLLGPDGTPFGLSLAGAGCAQHESGFDYYERRFGIDSKLPGVPARTITTNPGDIFIDSVEFSYPRENRRSRAKLPVETARVLGFNSMQTAAQLQESELQPYDRSRDVVAAWDDRSFALAGYSDAGRAFVDSLYEGFLTFDIAIGHHVRMPAFAYRAMIITRPSLMPADLVAQALETDLEHRRLQEAVAATGIVERLKANQQIAGWAT